jgi:hypothetical protein
MVRECSPPAREPTGHYFRDSADLRQLAFLLLSSWPSQHIAAPRDWSLTAQRKSRDEWAPRVTGTGHISPTQQVQCLFARGTIQAVQAFLHCRVELPHA